MIDFIERHVADVPDWVAPGLVALVAGLIGALIALAIHFVLFRLLDRIVRSSTSRSDDLLVRRLVRPTRWSFVAIGIVLAARETPALAEFWDRVSGFVMPLLVGWIAIAIMHSLIDAMMLGADITVENNRNARRRRTRLSIFNRIATFLIVFLTVALMLFSIPGVQKIGATLMASAGLAALAVGAAAQPALKALIGGFQMALTEPISIDDVVIIDGEWGKIEDIRTTYVVVALWDQRRLVVPTTRFLEDTFQNWTKKSSELLGTVMLYLDSGTDLAPIREEFTRAVEKHPLYDGRAQVVQVTDHTPDAMEVRLLMSARNAPTLFDLRCAMREHMLDWIRREMPDAIVRRRQLPVSPVELTPTAQMAEMIAKAPPANGEAH